MSGVVDSNPDIRKNKEGPEVRQKRPRKRLFRISGFGFPSDFGFRISDFLFGTPVAVTFMDISRRH